MLGLKDQTRLPWGAVAIIVIAALTAFGDSFGNAFVEPHIVDIAGNPSIRHLGDLGAVLRPPATGGMTVGGRPVLNLSLAVNYAIGGTAVWGYHAANLLIHVLAGLTLFGLVRRTARGRIEQADLLAFSVALLWVVHPLQTESVTYVIERAESLMGLFYLLTLYCFIRFQENRIWGLLSVLCCLLGMGTKEVMVSAPVIVLLYDWVFLSGSFAAAWRRHGRVYLGLAATWLLLGYLAGGTHDRGGTAGLGTVAWWTYAQTQFHAIVRYLRLAFWPTPLVFDYGAEWARAAGDVLPYAIFIATLFVASAVALCRRSPAGFLGAWFFAILAPTSLIPVVVQTSAEHRMYLALVPVVVAFVWPLQAGLARIGALRFQFPIILALAAALATVTAVRNLRYQSDATLWGLTAAQSPDNPRAHYYFGVGLDEAGRVPAAVEQFQSALSLKPDYPEAHNRLGIDCLRQGKPAEAMAQYAEAIRLRPEFAEARYNLGTALAEAGRLRDAEAELRRSLQFDPRNPDAHNNLGMTLAGMGRWSEAVIEYRRALELRPDYPLAQGNLRKALENAR